MSLLIDMLAAIAVVAVVYACAAWLLVREDRPRRWARGGRT